ncbi:LamG-like jellyroll fold domain-containing protein [Yeosuana sp. AK3]
MKTKLFFLLSSFLCLNLFSQTYMVNDNFEDDVLGTLPDGWVIRYDGTGSANQKVVDNPVKNGIHSFQLSGSSWAANLSKIVSEIPNQVTLEGWMLAENVASGGRCGLGIGNPSVGTWGALPARIEFYNGNLITYYHTGNSGGYGTQYVLQTASSNTWYHAKIETNIGAGTYKVYINGELASSNTTGTTVTEFPFLTSVSPTSVELYGNSMVYFDDIKLYKTLNLVAYYPFNGNANDESGNNLHGTVSGATLTSDRFGNPDSAYSFDGNDIITIAHNDILNCSDELSISVWIKPNTLQNAMILGKSNYVSNTNYLLRTKSTGLLEFEYKEFANSNSLLLTAGVWNHIAVVSNTDNSKNLYINGVLASHTTATSPYGLVTNALTIGARSGAEYFNGSIDDLRMYKSALSASDVSNLYNNNSLAISDNPIKQPHSFYIFNNTLHVDANQKVSEIKKITIYNLLAQKVFESNTIQKETDLSFLNPGIFILKVDYKNNKLETKKFIIQ